MLLSWYDRERDLESPAHASECHEGCTTRGFWDYALNRGGDLAVDFDGGRFMFCFRPLAESLRPAEAQTQPVGFGNPPYLVIGFIGPVIHRSNSSF